MTCYTCYIKRTGPFKTMSIFTLGSKKNEVAVPQHGPGWSVALCLTCLPLPSGLLWILTLYRSATCHLYTSSNPSPGSSWCRPYRGEVKGGDAVVVVQQDVDGVQCPGALRQQARLQGHHDAPRLGAPWGRTQDAVSECVCVCVCAWSFLTPRCS